MSGPELENEGSEWTKANLQKLLASLKANIPAAEKSSVYTRGLRAVNWNEVAFPPFSPEQCQKKWKEIFLKMRKIRTLTEIITEAEDVISNPAQNTKIHPELPKRPSPPNAIFYEEHWGGFQAQHPRMSRRMLFKLISKKYTELPEEEKSPYKEKFHRANEEYKRKMLEFRKHYENKPRNGERETKIKAKKKTDEDAAGMPPRPSSNGYHLFCKEQRASMVGVPKTSYVSVWAQRWRDLTEKERNKYNTRCAELKRRYKVKVNDFLMTLNAKEQERMIKKHGLARLKKKTGQDKLENVIKRIKTTEKMLPGEPKMPSRSGNVIFCKEQMQILKEQNPKSSSRERLAKCNDMWQKLSIEEKMRYKEKVSERLQQYSKELQKWFTLLTPTEQEKFRENSPFKCPYLVAKPREDYELEDFCKCAPSDSEDEDIEDCSSDEDEDYEEDDEEDDSSEEENCMFELF